MGSKDANEFVKGGLEPFKKVFPQGHFEPFAERQKQTDELPKMR